MKVRFVSLLPAVAWFITIFILLTLPGKDIPKDDWLQAIYFDKWVHTGLFAVLVFLFCFPLSKLYSYQSSLYILIVMLAIVYGIAMEYVQKYFTKDRSFDVTDMLADAFGTFLGYLLFRFISRRISQKNKPL